MRTRLHNLTTIFLTLLYGLVGLTGESLHYLVQDYQAVVRVVDSQPDEDHDHHHGYFHTHAPDNHLHYHHHHDEPEVASDNNDPSEAGLKTFQPFHSQHACPLLSFVSNLKLGAGGSTPLDVQSNASHATLRDNSLSHTSPLASHHYARGPPLAARLA